MPPWIFISRVALRSTEAGPASEDVKIARDVQEQPSTKPGAAKPDYNRLCHRSFSLPLTKNKFIDLSVPARRRLIAYG